MSKCNPQTCFVQLQTAVCAQRAPKCHKSNKTFHSHSSVINRHIYFFKRRFRRTITVSLFYLTNIVCHLPTQRLCWPHSGWSIYDNGSDRTSKAIVIQKNRRHALRPEHHSVAYNKDVTSSRQDDSLKRDGVFLSSQSLCG
jgi:hypothetical protein